MNGSFSPEQYSIRGHGSKYDRRREAAIAALLNSRTEQEAAMEAGISRRTLSRWKKLPEFVSAVHASKQEVLNNANTRYSSPGSAAASTVLKITVDPAARTSARLRAASQVHAVAEKSLEKEARSIESARMERQRQHAETEERSCSAEIQVLNLMESDGPLYVALVRQLYAKAELTRGEYRDLKRCNTRFAQIWRRLDIGFRYLRPDIVSFKIRKGISGAES
jgi:hypothetical protein